MGRHADELSRVRAQLAEADRAVTAGLASAAGALEMATEAHRVRLAVAVDQARSAFSAGRCEDYAPWDAPCWRSWTSGFHLPAELRLGEIDADLAVPLPATVPLFDGRTVVLATSGSAAAGHARSALRGLAVRAAAALGPSAVLHLVDPYWEGYGYPEREQLGNAAPLARDVGAALSAVIQAACPDAATVVRQVVLAMDFPRGYGYQGAELLNRVARLAPAGPRYAPRLTMGHWRPAPSAPHQAWAAPARERRTP